MHLLTGHSMHVRDVNTLTRLHSGNILKYKDTEPMRILSRLIQDKKIIIRIAIPDATEKTGGFLDRTGIFRDKDGNMVAFITTFSDSFYGNEKNLETVDVFTSWADKERVDCKLQIFNKLWDNGFGNVTIHSYSNAIKRDLLKYDPSWLVQE